MALPTVARAKALWDFAGGAPTDLPLRAGQIVNVTRKVDANWWEGEIDGKVGIFPVQYVQELPLESSPALPTRPAVTAQPAPSGPVCVTCAQLIPGDVLRWQGGAYHPGKCLCCKRCLALLGTDSVIKKVGTEPHCQVCFNELMFGPPKAPTAAVVAPAASVPAAPRPLPRPQPAPPVAHAPAHAVASPPVPAAAAHAPAVHSPVTPVRPAPPPPAPVAAPVQAEPTPPPLPARQGSNIAHRPAPPVPGLMATPAPPPAQQPQAPLVPHRAAPPPPPPAAAEPTPPPVPYASRPSYSVEQPPPAPYASRPAYGSPAAANYHSPPPATSPPPNNGMLMARPTGVIAHPNKPAPISPRGEQANPTPGYQPALKAGEAYIPPPPPPQVPVIIPPLNPYSTNKKVKAVFVGDPGVGKTAFLHAAVSGVFYQAYAPSVEGGLFNATVFTDSGKTAVDLELYDTPGDFYANPEYRFGLMGAADVIILMFDQLNRASYEHAENLWYAEIRDKYFTLKPLIIIATKSDQVKSQTRYDPSFVRHQECLDFAQRVDAAKFIDSSAQKNIMLRETLEKIAKLGTSPLSVIKGNKRVERVQTEKKKEGKRGVFGSLVDHVKYGM